MQVDPGGRRRNPAQRGPERELTERLRPRKTLRVQFLVSSLVIGGAERVLEALCHGLGAFQVRPAVGCLRDAGPIGRALRDAGVEVEEGLAPARRDWRQVFRLRRFLRSRRPHVLYCLDHSNVLWYGRLAAHLAGVRAQVVAVHRTRRADGRPSLSRSDRLLMRWTRRVIAVSDGHGRYLATEEGIEPGRITVIHNGVDPAQFEAPLDGEALAARRRELGLPAEGPVVGIVAALRPEKNHRLLLEALVRIPVERRPHLAVVGDGPQATVLRDAVAELDLRRSVHWLGTRGDVPRVLAALDLLVLCSDPNVETFPLCILEAMAARRPVVSTDVGSVAEMIEDGRSGLLVPAGQPAALAAAIERVLSAPDRGRSLGEAGAVRVARDFRREGMVRRTADLLWEVSGETRSAGPPADLDPGAGLG